MKRTEMLSHRLLHQQLVNPIFSSPTELLRWMGCIQAQDYAAAKWGIGCRLKEAADSVARSGKKAGIQSGTDAAIETLFKEGKILRTHILRPTWHFVLPEDVLWMLKLTAPGVRAFCSPYHRKLGIDKAIRKKSKSIIEKALVKQGNLTRVELSGLLEKAKIDTSDGRIGFLLMDAELDGLICSGGRKGKQFSYALLDDAAVKTYAMEESLALLVKRYFTSRGPATAADFAWWSGLSVKEAVKGIEGNRGYLQKETIEGKDYWFCPSSGLAGSPERSFGKSSVPLPVGSSAPSVHLLPAFDEYAISYKDRQPLFRPGTAVLSSSGLRSILVSEGRIVGIWKRIEKKGKLSIEISQPPKAAAPPVKAFKQACKKYAGFLERAFM